MKINNEEINLKITPKVIKKTEEMDEKFDILKLIRDFQYEGKEPRLSDYYRIVYTGYLGATNEDISFEDFLELVKDIDILEINAAGVDLLMKRKN